MIHMLAWQWAGFCVGVLKCEEHESQGSINPKAQRNALLYIISIFPHFSPFVQRTNDNNLTFIRPFSSERIPSILQIKHLYIPHLCLIFFFFFFALIKWNLMQRILFFSHALGHLRTDNFNHASHKASAVSSLAPK